MKHEPTAWIEGNELLVGWAAPKPKPNRVCVWCDLPLPHTCGPHMIDGMERTVTNNQIDPPTHADPALRSLLVAARAGVVEFGGTPYALTWVEGD